MNFQRNRLDRRQFLRGASTVALGTGVIAASGRTAAGFTRRSGIEFTTSDGVTLVGDILYPTDNQGDIANGEFPVILSMNPYNGNTDERTQTAYPPAEYLTNHGYIRAVFDVRGTGSSGGSWRAWGPREQQDYAELIDWIAKQPHADDTVGLIGASYLGYNQLLAAGTVDPDSPLEAIFPIIAGTDLWRSVWAPGGLVNTTFNAPWFGGVAEASPMSVILGSDEMSPDEAQDRAVSQTAGYYGTGLDFIVGQELGTDHAYREEYWRERSVTMALPDIVSNDIPVFHYTGLFDIFQPESIEVYTELQNLWAGRDQYAPMAPGQEVTGKYQMAIGPYMHITGTTPRERAVVVPFNRDLARKWFDRWLKGKNNGIDETDTPLHLFQAYGNRWVDAATWPLPETSVETFYLDGGTTETAPHSKNDGWLRSREPVGTSASDTLFWRPTSNPCQQAHHEFSIFTMPARDGCGSDNREWEATGLSYTSAAFEDGRNLAGPGSVTIYARADTPNTSWVVSLSDVAPDGTARQLCYGALLGSFRELDEEQSWYLSTDDDSETSRGQAPSPPAKAEAAGPATQDSDGKLVRPRPTYTRKSEQPVEPGEVERYDILLTPMFARIHPGHRLRLTIQTTAPWAEPAAKDVDELVGGTYQVQRNGVYPSRVNLPFAAGPLEISSTDWGECNFACGQTYRSD